MKKVGLFLLLLLSFECAHTQTIYYVDDNSATGDIWTNSVNGANTVGCGTIGSPCATVQFILDNRTLIAGDIIRIDAGTYIGKTTIASTDAGFTLEGADTSLTIFTDGITKRIFELTSNSNDNITFKKLKLNNVFNDNVSSITNGAGAAIYTGQSNDITGLIIDQCVVHNIDTDAGGAIYISPKSSATVTNSAFYNNSNTNSSTTNLYANGSAIYVDASALGSGQLTLSNSYFRNNQSDQKGGAVFYEAASGTVRTYTITNCIFLRNHSNKLDTDSQGGGAVYGGKGHTYTFTSCDFTGNYTTADYGTAGYFGGGAVTINASNLNTPVTFASCTFTGNYITNSNAAGGAINLNASNTTVTSPAIASMVTLTNCTFTDNYSESEDGDGGALALYANSANPYIYFNTSISGCTFTGNYTKNSALTNDGRGGAIIAGIGTISITSSTFSLNYAGAGGALYLNTENTTISNSTFTQNSAIYSANLSNNSEDYDRGGGALYLSATRGNSGHTISLTNNTFNQNSTSSTFGGAIMYNTNQYYDGNVAFSRNTFSQNSANTDNRSNSIHGGALFMGYYLTSNLSNTTVLLENCLFYGNSTNGNGAASYFKLGASGTKNLTIDFCTVTNNNSSTPANTHGIYVSNTAVQSTFTNSIFYDNGTSGYDVNALGTGTEIFSYSAYQKINSLATTGSGLRTDAPIFVNAATFDFHLANNSTHRDVANPTATLTNDRNGDVRPQGTGRDLGAFEGLGNVTASPQPIELLFFEAKEEFNQVILTWSTATEHNCRAFHIERKDAEGKTEPIGLVVGSMNSQEQQFYHLIDVKPVIGTQYYQLLEEDIDGELKLVGITSIQFKSAVKEVVGYYTLLGQSISEPGNDIYIILYSDGTSEKRVQL